MLKFTPKSCFFVKISLKNQIFLRSKFKNFVLDTLDDISESSGSESESQAGWRKIWKIFRVLSEMRGRFWYIDPSKSKFWVKIWWKCRNRLCQNLKFRFLKNLVSKKWEICTSKPEIRFRFWILEIEIQNLSPKLKNLHLETWNSISILNFWAENLISKISKI